MKSVAVIGLGRVGLPFALYLETLGYRVLGIDRDANLLSQVEKRIMPFKEQGFDHILKKSKISTTTDLQQVSEVDYIVITVGTPLHAHIETDISAIKEVISKIIPCLKSGQQIILRSTLAPKTTSFVKNLIEGLTLLRVGKDIGLAFCPERLAENHALEELKKLPQIIGVEDSFSKERCLEFYEPFAVKLFLTNYVSAELVKLFNNSSRYINFAIANHFAIIANEFNQSIYEILKMANEDYPRGNINLPGLTAGTCLRKDFGFINERSYSSDLLLSAWKVNEYMPFHMVESLVQKVELVGKRVAVLGYTFKKNADDTRDSLVPKLIRYIEREAAKDIKVCEPNILQPTFEGIKNHTLKEAIDGVDVVFIAVNHDVFDAESILAQLRTGVWVVDLWNQLKTNKFVFQK